MTGPASTRAWETTHPRVARRESPISSGPDLRVLFCGINPGRLSGELGLHFARSGNRFWKLLHAGGFTDRVLLPSEQATLPALGIGITNLVARTTAAASELTSEELRAGARDLEAKVAAPAAPVHRGPGPRRRTARPFGAHARPSANNPRRSDRPRCGCSPTRVACRRSTSCPR